MKFYAKIYRAEARDFYNQVIVCEIHYFFPGEVYFSFSFFYQSKMKNNCPKRENFYPH